MSKALADLLPDVQIKATAALANLKARGIPYVVTYTLRTYAEQAALYAQGRQDLLTVNSLRDVAGLPHIGQADNSYIVTQCDGKRKSEGGTGRSPHQLGTALDVVPLGDTGPIWPSASDPRWAQIAQSFKANGFEWGGDWADFPDFPHYQLSA
jgi:peptidoglycan L-alanyl-D-glutamate endopeptidase CwlK